MSAQPAPILPPELTINPPLTPVEVDEVRTFIDTLAFDSGLSPVEMAAEVVEHAGPPEESEPALPAGAYWRIQNDDEAEWAMRHLAEAEANRRAILEQQEAYIARIEEWTRNALRAPQRDISFFGGHLEAYALELRRRNPKHATLTLPSGAVRTTKASPKIAVEDDETVATWGRETLADDVYPTVVKSKVLLTGLKALGTITSRVTGRWVVEVDCGCSETVGSSDQAAALSGTEMLCPADPEHGTVAVTAVWEETEPCVVDGAGQVIPGTAVTPEHITAKATPS